MSAPIVIIGSGLAGINTLREFRKLDADTPVIVLSADGGDFYSKPMLSNGLAQKKSAAQLVATPREKLAEQTKADIRPNVRVERLLPGEHAVETSAGRIEYGKLVLALGAYPIRLQLGGAAAAEVLSVNSLDDYAVYRTRLEGKRSVALLGAGLIGCEFANDLRLAGIEVDVFDIAPQALGRLLPPKSAALFRAKLEAAGVRFHFETIVNSVNHEGERFVLLDNQNVRYEADLVVSAVGLRPEVSLAKLAGLKINLGIVTDKQLATSAQDVYAIGDCAEVVGNVLPFVMPIMSAAKALGKTLTGTPTEVSYPAMPVVVKTPACPTVVCPPPGGRLGVWREDVAGDEARAYLEEEGKLIGFALLGAATRERAQLGQKVPAWI